MDNEIQINEIRKYREYLKQCIGYDIDENLAAILWIKKYAKLWRLAHPMSVTEKCVLQ